MQIIIEEKRNKRRRKPLSDEHKRKLSIAMMGKSTAWLTGVKVPQERIDKIRKTLTGQKHGPMPIEQRLKISASRKGVKMFEEGIRKKLENLPRGDKHWHWKGGITPVNVILRNNENYRAWRKAVYSRDKYTCQKCGAIKGVRYNAHHIKPFSLFPELRYAVDNGVTLCVGCHNKETYGNKIGN